jgi:hypothetical protein
MNIQHPSLLPYQYKAIEFIQKTAIKKREEALKAINTSLSRLGLDINEYKEAMINVQSHAKIDIHFHPERISISGKCVAEGFLEEGEFKSQFETGLSSGSPTAFKGGERDLWEKHLFGGAYQIDEASFINRPKYGALEIMYHPDGACPRFGSCFFMLNSDVSKRSTYTFGGSQEDDALEKTGTLSVMDSVMAALILEIEKGQGALGVNNLTVKALLMQLRQGLSAPYREPSTRSLGKTLDSFIEAQIHGKINLYEDVERLVADPSFKNGPIGKILEEICEKFNILLYWHPGFVLPVANVPEYFRDYAVKPLAQRIAGQGMLDAAKIGIAANSLLQEPKSWKGWGTYNDILTQFRRLWHVLVLYGEPNKAINQ